MVERRIPSRFVDIHDITVCQSCKFSEILLKKESLSYTLSTDIGNLNFGILTTAVVGHHAWMAIYLDSNLILRVPNEN